ncbi:MAG: DNA mismatch repair endonuclease MutL [Elusimicrobia bacterium]|nr:DNA mismatch repair endonuclease MutL [Elusimicrobiota bacterium]
MSPRIRLLSPSVSSLIAAGEVIERPASALKELIENSLDAGARRISVEVAGAGRKLLRVSDDGRGMDPEDCALALERHATSKIAGIADLDALSTFGFRGEALFAIAAVSKMTLTSALKDGKNGWRVEAEAGKVTRSSPAAAAAGTTVEIRDLFFNTPARLKFLRSDSFETSRLILALEEAALANPEAGFSYKSEGRKALSFAPAASRDPLERRRERLAAVLGRETAEGLACSAFERPGLKAWIFVSTPGSLVPTRSIQHWLVNKRPVQSRALQQALYRAFRDVRSRDRHPVCVAHLEVPPDQVDVNVHPGKREIRFKRERDIHELVVDLIARALAGQQSPRSASSEAFSIVAERQHAYHPGKATTKDSFQESHLDLCMRPAETISNQPGTPGWFRPPYRYLGQIEGSFLVFEASGGLFVLDQHAAAERVLFERYLGRVREGGRLCQPLMLPLPVELGASRQKQLLGHKERLAALGFGIEPFGKTVLHVVSAPDIFHKEADLKEMVLRLLDHLADPGHAAVDVVRDAAATIACKRAVKAHDLLTEREALRLLEDLKACANGTCCPHGRPAMMALTRDELARRFDRSGAV